MDPDHDLLASRYVAGDRDPALLARLRAAVAADAELRAELIDELALERMLRELARPALDGGPVLAAIAAPGASQLEDQVMARIARVEQAGQLGRWRDSLLTFVHGGIRPGGSSPVITALAALAALLLVGVLGVVFAMSALRPSASAPGAPSIATATAAAEPLATLRLVHRVRWPDGLAVPPVAGARIGPGAIALAAGVVDVQFDNGATIRLEGPVEVDVVSPMLVELRRGRLTTDVPPAARGFTVASGGVRVVDVGTEAGIEAGADGRVDVQVYVGAVELSLASTPLPAGSGRITAGMAVRADPAVGRVAALAFSPGRFSRAARRGSGLDLADIIGGGDGLGSASHEGIDVTTGALVSGPSLGSIPGDDAYRPLPGLPFIDGVFMPAAAYGERVVTSTGLRHAFALASHGTYDIIRRGGFMIRPPDGEASVPTRSPSVIAGVDHDGLGHSLVGFHANAGITFDLQAIARAHGRPVTRFTARVANTAPRRLAPTLCLAPDAFAPGREAAVAWTPLRVERATALGGTVLTRQADGSLLASFPAPTDTYTVTGSADLPRLTALKLEVLADPSLPGNGPGTSSHGNFVLSWLRVAVAEADGQQQPVEVTGAVADFSQAGWPVGDAVRDVEAGGWAVVPQTGRDHTAVFFLDPTALPADGRVVVGLAQLQAHWHHHLVGRFRISATADPDPARGLALGAGFFQVLVDGQLVQRSVVPLADQAPALLDARLSPGQRFLTLVSTDGGYGNGYQWTTLGDPRLDLE